MDRHQLEMASLISANFAQTPAPQPPASSLVTEDKEDENAKDPIDDDNISEDQN